MQENLEPEKSEQNPQIQELPLICKKCAFIWVWQSGVWKDQKKCVNCGIIIDVEH